MPSHDQPLSKVLKKPIVKRGKRGQKNNLNSMSKEISSSSTIYYNLIKPIRKTVPILVVKPTPRPLQIAEQNRVASIDDSDISDAETVIFVDDPDPNQIVELITLD